MSKLAEAIAITGAAAFIAVSWMLLIATILIFFVSGEAFWGSLTVLVMMISTFFATVIYVGGRGGNGSA